MDDDQIDPVEDVAEEEEEFDADGLPIPKKVADAEEEDGEDEEV